MNKATERLLQELDTSPTDLAKLVRAVVHKQRSVLSISADTIRRWERDDPRSWRLVRQWLSARGVEVMTRIQP